MGRKQNKQLNKENKDAQIVAFLMLEYTETSVGAHDKNLIKEDLYPSKYTGEWRSGSKTLRKCLKVFYKISLKLLCAEEKAHICTCMRDWGKNIQTVGS